MNIRSIKVFDVRNWFKIVKYSLGSRMINSVPKGLKNTYDFVVWMEKKGISFTKKHNQIEFQYPIDKVNYLFSIDESSSDSDVFNQIVVCNEYEPVRELISLHNIQIKTIIDAGANVGYTCIYLSHYYPGATILALEPNIETFNRLKRNIDINKLNNVKLFQKGLWNKNTYLKADYSFRDKQAWSFRLEETSVEQEKLFEVVSVEHLLSSNNIEEIDLLKIDVEGGEKEIFNTNFDLSWLNKVKVIAIEIHDEFDCREQIENKLKEYFILSYSGELTIGVNKSI